MKTGFLFFTLIVYSNALISDTMNVQIKSATLKSTPSFLASTLVTLHYGDSVSTLSKNGDWIEVKTPAKKGWLHTSALTTKEISLSNGSKAAPNSVSSNEVMMAGKGFNVQVEQQYRRENPALRFDLVDKMEKSTVSAEAQRQFAKTGQLTQ